MSKTAARNRPGRTSVPGVTGMGRVRPQAGGARSIVSAAGTPPWRFGPSEAQPNRGVMRLNGVIANLIHRPDRHVALDLLLRLAAVAMATIAILGLLPAIAGVAA
jgi:hypothetical protein